MTAVAPPSPTALPSTATPDETALSRKPWFAVLRVIRLFTGRVGRYEVLALFRSYHDAEIFASVRAKSFVEQLTPGEAARSAELGYHDVTTP